MPDNAREIENLIYAYAERIDAGDLDGVAELFRHGRIEAAPGVVVRGRRAGARPVRRARPACTTTARRAPGTSPPTWRSRSTTTPAPPPPASYYTVFQQTDELPLQPIIAGRYHDTFHRVDGEWCFDTREMFVDLTGDLSHHLLFELR